MVVALFGVVLSRLLRSRGAAYLLEAIVYFLCSSILLDIDSYVCCNCCFYVNNYFEIEFIPLFLNTFDCTEKNIDIDPYLLV